MTEQELRQAYESQKPVLQARGNAVTTAVLSGIEKKLGTDGKLRNFLKVPAEPRVKETESFLAKALRRGKNYERPLEDITDKVGVRFVVLLSTELKTVQEVVESSALWEADKSRDFEEERIARPHHFDYQSVHYIVRARKPLACVGVNGPAGTPCEVQVRTLLQHAYAELAHNLTYKPSLAVDREVNRTVANSMALMETTDELFVLAHNKVEAASAELRRVHEMAAEAYGTQVGRIPASDLRLCFSLLDPFRDLLPTLTKEVLTAFLAENDFSPEKVRERAPLALLYQHPCALVVYWLVAEHPDLVPKLWPADLKHLEMLYTDLGLSAEGRLW